MDQMMVNENGGLNANVHPKVLRFFASFFSYLFHPLFMIAWVTLYLLFRNSIVFIGETSFEKLIVFLRVFSTSIFLPIVTVLLLKGLGFIDSIQLHTQKDRIIPYVACITFFFWSFYVSKKIGDPSELTAFLLSAFIASSASLIINNYMKVSMHAMGVGGLTAFFSLLLFANRLDDVFSLLLVFLIAGITTTSRFIVSDHKPAEIAVGFVTGVLIQGITWFIIR
ncbi:MAG: hypothetical protein ABL872_13995 [Lacibacter sp.]